MDLKPMAFLVDWFKNNKMILNPDKFQGILLDKRKSDHTNQSIVVDNQNIKLYHLKNY